MRSPQHWRTGCCPVSSHLRVGSLPNGNWRWTSESADRSCVKHFARSSNAVSSTSNPAEARSCTVTPVPDASLHSTSNIGAAARQLANCPKRDSCSKWRLPPLATEHADEDDLSNMEMALERLEGERDTTRAGPK